MNYFIIDGYIQKEWKSLIVVETTHDVLYILTRKDPNDNIRCHTTHGLQLNIFTQTYLIRVRAGRALNVSFDEDYKILKALQSMENLLSLHNYTQIRLTLIKN